MPGARARCACCATGAGMHGHDDGRLADHRPARRSTVSISMPAGAMAASRRRRPRAGASPISSRSDEPHPVRRRLSARPLRHRRADRRARRRRAAQSALRPHHAHHLSLLRRARQRGVHLSRRRHRAAAATASTPGRDRALVDYVYLRDNPAGPHRELGITARGCRAWLVVTRNIDHASQIVRRATARRRAGEPTSHDATAAQPARHGRPDRSRAAARASRFDGAAYDRPSRRHARLGAARQRRAGWSAARSSIIARAAS